MKKIAIVGGGVSGGTALLYLSALGLDVTLFEQKDHLVSGPPFCHLHAGGNLYREIDDNQCITLLQQSIDLLKFYPYAVDFRPTVIITPNSDDEDPKDLLPRLQLLQKEYEKLIQEDISNKVLGQPQEYYKIYNKEELLNLKDKVEAKEPNSLDEWMIPVVKNIDLDNIKYPVVIVQEYGLNIFRVSSGLALSIKDFENGKLNLNSQVIDINQDNHKFVLEYKKNNEIFVEDFDYLINAAGFKTGSIDDMLGFGYQRFVEFKAAYVTKWESKTPYWPEIIFHGKRGTPKGMAQFTPYADDYFQLHGMTKNITLFDNGLVKSDDNSAQPKLENDFLERIDHNWCKDEVETRTKKAIEHVAQFMPNFKDAKVASKPLYGAQQIPGNDEDLRAADVTFVGDNYARCEVVKASSVLDMIDAIVQKLIKLEFIDSSFHKKRDFEFSQKDESILLEYAQSLCQSREYPESLAKIRWKNKI
jgi:hypothetical protein